MKNLTEFCKTVETGVDPLLRRISIIISKLEVQCRLERQDSQKAIFLQSFKSV